VSDRYAGFVVTLTANIRDDDAKATVAAIGQIKGVLTVTPIGASPELAIAEGRARLAVYNRVLATLAGGAKP
jgi:hypothetical protein